MISCSYMSSPQRDSEYNDDRSVDTNNTACMREYMKQKRLENPSPFIKNDLFTSANNKIAQEFEDKLLQDLEGDFHEENSQCPGLDNEELTSLQRAMIAEGYEDEQTSMISQNNNDMEGFQFDNDCLPQ